MEKINLTTTKSETFDLDALKEINDLLDDDESDLNITSIAKSIEQVEQKTRNLQSELSKLIHGRKVMFDGLNDKLQTSISQLRNSIRKKF